MNAAKNAHLERLIVGCMPGKLFKYACGEKYTHAHKTKLMLPRLRELTAELPAELPLESMESMGELATKVPAERYRKILHDCYEKASEHLSAWGGDGMKTEIALYNDQGERLI